MTLKIQFEDAYWKIQEYFFSFPSSEVGLNELCEKLNIAKSNAKKIILELEEIKFLHKKIIGKMWRISVNPVHSYNRNRKIYLNLMKLLESNILQKINETYPGSKSIILFGSYRKGDDTELSDLDLAVELTDKTTFKIVDFGKINIGMRKNIKINLHIFSRKNIDLNLFSNIANGIILDGFLEAKP